MILACICYAPIIFCVCMFHSLTDQPNEDFFLSFLRLNFLCPPLAARCVVQWYNAIILPDYVIMIYLVLRIVVEMFCYVLCSMHSCEATHFKCYVILIISNTFSRS